MGDRLTEDDQPKQTSPTPYGDIFDELCPEYLSIGMTYDEYWDGEYGMKRSYRKAYLRRTEHEQRLADQNNWYMGQYVISALQAVPLLVSGFNVKPSTSIPEYVSKPFLVSREEEKKEEIRQKNEEDQTRLAMAVFQASIVEFNKRFRKEEKPESSPSGQ